MLLNIRFGTKLYTIKNDFGLFVVACYLDFAFVEYEDGTKTFDSLLMNKDSSI